jgi:hypothetical protein
MSSAWAALDIWTWKRRRALSSLSVASSVWLLGVPALAELSAYENASSIASKNSALFNAVREDILGIAGYTAVREAFTGAGKRMALWGVTAIVAGAAYLLTVSYKPPDPKKESDSNRPVFAMLVKHSDQTSDRLWEAGRLTECETVVERGGQKAIQVSVLLEEGDGSADDPWIVRTFPGSTANCGAKKFSVIADVATLIVPEEEIKITYTPIPTPSVSPTP